MVHTSCQADGAFAATNTTQCSALHQCSSPGITLHNSICLQLQLADMMQQWIDACLQHLLARADCID